MEYHKNDFYNSCICDTDNPFHCVEYDKDRNWNNLEFDICLFYHCMEYHKNDFYNGGNCDTDYPYYCVEYN